MYVLEELNNDGEWRPIEGFYDGEFYILQTFSDLQHAIDEYEKELKDHKHRLTYYERKSVVDVG